MKNLNGVEKTKTKKMCNLIICDASGSMGSKVNEVRSGLKELFYDIRNNNTMKSRTIICDFSSAGDFNVIADTKDPSLLTDRVADGYNTRGMTALYDAIGMAFRLVDKKYDGVFVNILTDGLENNSVEFKLADIQKLIKTKRKKERWAITFMGTTEEALEEASSWGIAQSNMMQYADSAEGVEQASVKRQDAREVYYQRVCNSVYSADVGDEGLMDDSKDSEEKKK